MAVIQSQMGELLHGIILVTNYSLIHEELLSHRTDDTGQTLTLQTSYSS